MNRFAQSLTVRRMFSLLDYPGILSQLSPGVNRNLHIFPAKVPAGMCFRPGINFMRREHRIPLGRLEFYHRRNAAPGAAGIIRPEPRP